MGEGDVVLKTVTKIVIFILPTFDFYIYLTGHNNPGGGFTDGLVLSSAFILMFLAFDVKEVLDGLPIDFGKLMIIGALISLITAITPTFFDKSFLYQGEFILRLPMFNEMHIITAAVFELGIVLSVVGVIVTIMSTSNGGKP